MEQRSIDGLALYCDLKKLEELARQRYLDTPPNSPVFSTYKAQMHERTALKEMVSEMPTIDPIHAAGACYCRECKWFLGKHILHNDGTIELVDEHSDYVSIDVGVNCQARCKRLGYVNNLFVSDSGNGFCSYGERKAT